MFYDKQNFFPFHLQNLNDKLNFFTFHMQKFNYEFNFFTFHLQNPLFSLQPFCVHHQRAPSPPGHWVIQILTQIQIQPWTRSDTNICWFNINTDWIANTNTDRHHPWDMITQCNRNTSDIAKKIQ